MVLMFLRHGVDRVTDKCTSLAGGNAGSERRRLSPLNRRVFRKALMARTIEAHDVF